MEALKLYANPEYNINSSRIGSGNVSLTTAVLEESISTYLPEYQVFKKGDHTQQSPVAYDSFILEDKNTYEDKLNARREYQPPVPVQGNSSSSKELKFNIIDTPGLNDTEDQDEDHVSKIFSALGGKSLDLVLVTVSRGAFTQGLQQALRSYMNLFPQLGDIVAFVHTRVNYLELHPGMTDFQSYKQEKMKTLSTLMGRSSFPHFWIDCDFETTKPVRKCITNNTLRRILRLAVMNKSVVMLHSKTLNKTPKMREIDRIIKDQVQAVILAIESTLEFKDKEEGAMLQAVYIHATEINELRAKINMLKDLRKSYQTDELGLLYEKRHDDIQGPLAKGLSLSVPYEGKYAIDEVVVWCENFQFSGSDGQRSLENWLGGSRDVVMWSDSTKIDDSDGQLSPKDEHPSRKDGHQSPEDGRLSPQEKQLSPDDGHLSSEDGHLSSEDGHLSSEDGHLSPGDEHLSPEDGHLSPEDEHLSPEDGQQSPNDGHLLPDDGQQSPNDGHLLPDVGHLLPDVGHLSPDVGHLSPEDGHLSPEDGHLLSEDGYLSSEDGHMSPKNWKGVFKKETKEYNGYYHVKLYTKKSSRFKVEIDDLAIEIAKLKKQLQQKIDESAQQPKEALLKIQSLVDAHNLHMEVIRLASADTLHRDLFVKLVEDRAFAGPTNESSERVAAIYREFAHKRLVELNKHPLSRQVRCARPPQMSTKTPARSNATKNVAEGQQYRMRTICDQQQQQTPQVQPQAMSKKLPPLPPRRAMVGSTVAPVCLNVDHPNATGALCKKCCLIAIVAHPPTSPISRGIIFAVKMAVGKSLMCNIQSDLYNNICGLSESTTGVTAMDKSSKVEDGPPLTLLG
ncbi:hypothetical protein BGZ81_010629 [Podila clonocystis]|nr:hypothetical protein BGZ81_010629 [Podila clonocystis]